MPKKSDAEYHFEIIVYVEPPRDGVTCFRTDQHVNFYDVRYIFPPYFRLVERLYSQ